MGKFRGLKGDFKMKFLKFFSRLIKIKKNMDEDPTIPHENCDGAPDGGHTEECKKIVGWE